MSHVDCAADKSGVPRMPPRDVGDAVRFGRKYQIRISRVRNQSSKQGKTRKIVTEIKYKHWCGCGLKDGVRSKSQIRKHEHRCPAIDKKDAEKAAAAEYIALAATADKRRKAKATTMTVFLRDTGCTKEIAVQSNSERANIYNNPKYAFNGLR